MFWSNRCGNTQNGKTQRAEPLNENPPSGCLCLRAAKYKHLKNDVYMPRFEEKMRNREATAPDGGNTWRYICVNFCLDPRHEHSDCFHSFFRPTFGRHLVLLIGPPRFSNPLQFRIPRTQCFPRHPPKPPLNSSCMWCRSNGFQLSEGSPPPTVLPPPFRRRGPPPPPPYAPRPPRPVAPLRAPRPPRCSAPQPAAPRGHTAPLPSLSTHRLQGGGGDTPATTWGFTSRRPAAPLGFADPQRHPVSCRI